jgi:aspartyl-tRNA(Asn)/glutamyl-tRNA(Gln) amidotransferase subunit B
VKLRRFQEQYGLSAYDASVLTAEQAVADYFEKALHAFALTAPPPKAAPKVLANWITGDLFALLNQNNLSIEQSGIEPLELARLVRLVLSGEINQNTAKNVLAEMFETGAAADVIVERRGLRQISDADQIAVWVGQALRDHPEEVASYLAGKENLSRWLFGQVMRFAGGKANPQLIQQELERQLSQLKSGKKS